jgi:hypothetical protein
MIAFAKSLKRPWDAIVWWEMWRIPFNVSLLVAGLTTIAVVEFIGGRLVTPGDDVVEPMGMIAGVIVYAVGANVCYSMAWITELAWSQGDTSRTEPLRPKVFRRGLIFSVLLTLLPIPIVLLLWALSGFK